MPKIQIDKGKIIRGKPIILNDFITIWLGKEYLLSNFVVAMIVGHLCFNGMLFATFTFRNTAGEFNHFKFAPVLSAFVNIILSILLYPA